jgi:RHS repeat-associated protein
VHTDHLNTPRKIAQPTTGTLAWRWDADPFGTAAPNDNPAGLGSFAYNLRFPGQYYMAETGINQNWNRDYDPLGGGRYIESDPIGLGGGNYSTYTYSGGNSISNIDPLGLFGYPQHISITNQALGGDTSFPGLARDVAGVDLLPGSQDPVNSFWHAMSDGLINQPAWLAQDLFNDYVDTQLSSCTIEGLARALHAVQDSAARGHKGFQPWYGGSTPLHIPSLSHINGDWNPSAAEKTEAVQKSRGIIQRFKKSCNMCVTN